ncbi:MAG: MFS transporter [Bacteroidales bacterium]|nr:MFS transporter [Bacteroidales bacterium]MCF8390935.1 MFS transporter [Bacteroidales bacterium]
MNLLRQNKLTKEFDFFLSMPRDMRILLITNVIYALVIPVIDIFVGAYIMRSSNEPGLVAIYQLAAYTGIPITFMINGFLLNKIKIAHLYSFGMILSGISMVFMMTLGEMNALGVGFAGLIMGSSFGFFWANRDYLALNTTNDENRNYYYGLETFFYTLTFIIVPVLIGWFLISSGRWEWIGDIGNAYKIVTIIVFILTIISSIIIHRGKYENPKQKRFLYFKFDKLWNKMLVLAALKGLAQGYLVTAPAILIMRLVGDEGSLGTIQSLAGVLSAIVLYFLGRLSKPEHRIYIFSVGIFIFFLGTLVNGILFSASGVIVFVMCKVMFMPLHDIAYFPIQMKVIDSLSLKENRNQFAYIFNHEFGLYIGRFLGLGLFIFLIYYVSESFALKYSLIIIASVQLLAIPVAKGVIKASNNYITKAEPTLTPTQSSQKKTA